MPLASVSFSHSFISPAFLVALRHGTRPVEYPAVTFPANLPPMIAVHTRPCRLHPHIAASSFVRPWLSAWNHSAILPSRSRLGPPCTFPPWFAKKKLSAFFSL